MPLPAPDPTVLHPVARRRTVLLRPLVQNTKVDVGEERTTTAPEARSGLWRFRQWRAPGASRAGQFPACDGLV